MDGAPEQEGDGDLERLRYPIGRFEAREGLSPDERSALIDDMAALPADLRAAVSGLSDEQLDTPYRPDGWTVRQVVHHLPDSHLNGYVRLKLAVTESEPTIRTYDEAAWAELADGRDADVGDSLLLLEALHRRWVRFLRSLGEEAFGRVLVHPEEGRVSVDLGVQLYRWHGRHHLAHVARLGERMGW